MGLNVAVVGFGLVGKTMVRVLKERRFPVDKLKILARSTRDEELDGETYHVKQISEEEFEGVDLALFAGSEGVGGASATYAPVAVENGAVVIDNSSTFRMEPDVPLVVPEVNFEAIPKGCQLIANPNCSTIQMVVALAPLRRFGIKRVVVSTYQSVSGWGTKAMEQLTEQTRAILAGEQPQVDSAVFPHQIAFNVLPHIDVMLDDGSCKEEWKMVHETRKIFGEENLPISATTVRVPVYVGHAEAVNVELEQPLSAAQAREVLAQAEGVEVIDDPQAARYPLCIEAAGSDLVYVGRIREDPSVEHGLNMWVVADNLRKGAATNAIQIAERMLQAGYL